MVLVVAVIAVVVVVVKVLVWTAVIIIEKPIAFEALFINVRVGAVIDTLVGVEEIAVVTTVVTALEFAAPISYFVDALSDMVVNPLVDVLDMIIGFVSDIVSVFASLMTALELLVPSLSREFGCPDTFGC